LNHFWINYWLKQTCAFRRRISWADGPIKSNDEQDFPPVHCQNLIEVIILPK